LRCAAFRSNHPSLVHILPPGPQVVIGSASLTAHNILIISTSVANTKMESEDDLVQQIQQVQDIIEGRPNWDRHAYLAAGGNTTPRNANLYFSNDPASVPPEYDTPSVDDDSVYTTSTVSTHAPTIFSHRSAHTSSARSAQPPRMGPADINFMQTLQAQATADYGMLAQDQAAGLAPIQADDHPLWCETRNLCGCRAEFSIADTDLWIEHHRVDHLRDRFPSQLVCWFCDHVPFVAAHKRDRYSNFVSRMQHIRQHIWDDYRVPDDMRPDYWMITHMRELGIISKTAYDTALGYSEVPGALRLPGGSSTYADPAEPRASDGSHVHNLRRERRPPRAHGHHSHHGSGQHRHGHQ
jgi:hypothetical protein